MTNFQMLQKSTALSLYTSIRLFATSKHTLSALDSVRCSIKAFYRCPTNGMYAVINNRMKTVIEFYNLYH